MRRFKRKEKIFKPYKIKDIRFIYALAYKNENDEVELLKDSSGKLRIFDNKNSLNKSYDWCINNLEDIDKEKIIKIIYKFDKFMDICKK